MFTIRPPKFFGRKDGNGNGNGNGHSNGNGNGNGHNGNGNGNGNGHGKHIESVLGPGTYWQGALNGAGAVRIEGSFDGKINIKGALVIADGAKVTSDEEIQAKVVSVAGTVKGNIRAEKVDILSTGRVYGDLITGAFSSEDGAFLRGRVTMQDDPTALPKDVALGTEPAPSENGATL